ncbi:hypothetical protein KP509_15G049700 [Ceratopteris richardii]|uniref:Uncharacterized protein n=1 Tax=Ceratopteris richardii TaxID=49495 RepID=A0A8T2T808_CERRI|nr:hypothetical protein KP509_15G049700 [Ceratopteris richardii]
MNLFDLKMDPTPLWPPTSISSRVCVHNLLTLTKILMKMYSLLCYYEVFPRIQMATSSPHLGSFHNQPLVMLKLPSLMKKRTFKPTTPLTRKLFSTRIILLIKSTNHVAFAREPIILKRNATTNPRNMPTLVKKEVMKNVMGHPKQQFVKNISFKASQKHHLPH